MEDPYRPFARHTRADAGVGAHNHNHEGALPIYPVFMPSQWGRKNGSRKGKEPASARAARNRLRCRSPSLSTLSAGKRKEKKGKKFNGNRSPIVQPVPQTHALVTKKCRCGYHRSKRLKCKAMLSCLRQNEDGTQSVRRCPPEYHSFREGFFFTRWEVF